MRNRVAVIGCGQWGRNHVRTLAALGALAAVADRDPAKAAAFADAHGVRGLSSEDAIADPDIDAVVLALPAAVHGRFARAAFAAGKDALVEKPIALDPADAEATRAAARGAGRILMVGHVLRYHPAFRALQGAVAAGRIGRLRHLSSTRFGFGRFPAMDVIWDLGPHDLSLALGIAGAAPIASAVRARPVLSERFDAAEIALRFPDGVSAALALSRVSPYRDRRFAAIGTNGALVFDGLAPDGAALRLHALAPDANGFALADGDGEVLPVAAMPPLEAELRHFLDCCAARREPDTGADEAVETVRLLAALSPPTV